MSDTIIAVIITGVCSLLGTIITVLATSRKTQTDMAVRQAVTDEKIESLTQSVRQHNEFGRRIPVIEEKISNLDDRVGSLERKVG